jgi:hypothetical protein
MHYDLPKHSDNLPKKQQLEQCLAAADFNKIFNQMSSGIAIFQC